MDQTSLSMQRLARAVCRPGGDGGRNIRILGYRAGAGRSGPRCGGRSPQAVSARSRHAPVEVPGAGGGDSRRAATVASGACVRSIGAGVHARRERVLRIHADVVRGGAVAGDRQGQPAMQAFEKMSTKPDVLKHLKEGFAYAQSAVGGVDPANLASRKLFGGNYTILEHRSAWPPTCTSIWGSSSRTPG